MNKPLIGFSVSSILLVSFSSQGAEDYTTFLSAEYSSLKTDITSSLGNISTDRDTWQLSASHYFTPRPIMGPLKEFQFINQQSFIATSASFSDENDSQQIRGEYIWNDWVVSASHSFGDADTASLGVGYFINQDFKVSVYNRSFNNAGGLFDSDESNFMFSAEYVYPLAGKDYLGASFTTNEDFNFSTLVTKYFTAIGTEQYLSLAASAVVYSDDINDTDDSLSFTAEYYISKFTSFSAGLVARGESDGFSLGASHYFDENSSLSISYSDYESSITANDRKTEYDRKRWNIGYQYQF